MIVYLQNNLEKIRWGLLLVFIIGYAITYTRFSYAASTYLIYSVLAISSGAILLTQLKSYEKYYSAIWLVLGVFIIVYFIRFYWIAVDPMPVKIMLHPPIYKKMIQDNALFESYRISVISFIAFSVSIVACLYLLRNRYRPSVGPDSVTTGFDRFVIKGLLLSLPIFMLVLAVISHKYQIGKMGVDSGEPLPFRLKGIIFYARYIMIPLLIVLLIYLSGRSDHTLVARLGILLLLTHGVVDMLLRGSRSSLLLCLLLLLFLIMSGGLKLYRNEKILALFLLGLGLFMVPIMTEYRMQRVAQHLPVIDAISMSFSTLVSGGWTTLLGGIEFVLFRMPGIEAVSAIISMDAEPLGMRAIDVFQSKQGMAGYLTHDVYLYPQEVNNLAAPGFIGWLYLVRGVSAVAIGSIVLAIVVTVGWYSLDSGYLTCSPVAQTFFLWMLFHGLTEGTFDSMLFMLVVGVLTLLVVEVVLRIGSNTTYFQNTKD